MAAFVSVYSYCIIKWFKSTSVVYTAGWVFFFFLGGGDEVGIIFFDNSITPLIEIQTMAFQKLLTTHENASLKGKIDDS